MAVKATAISASPARISAGMAMKKTYRVGISLASRPSATEKTMP